MVWVYGVDQSVFQAGSSRADWPKIRHDPRNTGRYARPDPAAVLPAESSPHELACFPNPAVAGARILLRTPGAGELSAFDASGRVLSRRVGSAGEFRELRLDELLGVADRPGIYFLRWAPIGGVTATHAVRLTVVPGR